MALSLNAPIEDLRLSIRVRNVLRLSGLHTIASLLECDYKAALRGFGPEARAELASALESNGFTPPANLNPSEIDDLADDISKLFGQMEASFSKWSARVQYFEMRIRELTAKGHGHQCCSPGGAKVATTSAAVAQEFGTRLMSIRTASAALRDETKLPPQPQEAITLVEEKSVQLSVLVSRFIETLPANGAREPHV